MKISEDLYLIGSGEIRLSNSLDSHVYLLTGKEGAIMIDAGSGLDTEEIMSNVIGQGLDPREIKYLFLTHCHFDHAAGASDVRSRTSCQVIASVEERSYIEHGSEKELALDVCKKTKLVSQDFKYKHCRVDRSLGDKETLEFGAFKITSVVLPGHSYGVLCLLVEFGGRRVFFSSDAVFIGGTIGLGNWPGSSLQAYRESIWKLKGLNVDQLFPGHYLWTLREGQEHLNRAMDNLSYGWIPPVWGHIHPVIF